MTRGDKFPTIASNRVIIDGLYGAGLNRPLEGGAKELVKLINSLDNEVVAIDIPSGLMGENNGNNPRDAIIKASVTFTFQFPKLAFLFPENHENVGYWELIPINLHPAIIELTPTDWYLTTDKYCKGLLPKRGKFDHKGTNGHVLLVAGSYGKMGAAILAGRACMKAGAGLLTMQVPASTNNMVNLAVPEALVSIDNSGLMFTGFPELTRFDAVAVGPATGKSPDSCKALNDLLDAIGTIPLVLDADAINILAENPGMVAKLPPNTILTPHPKEFARLCGESSDDYARLQKAIAFCKKHETIMVLKGAHTAVILPDGTCRFNSTGNPGMATAGSGDVLTGIILALLGRGIPPGNAAVLAVYLHGLAGDIACITEGMDSLTASDIVSSLGQAFTRIINQ